MNKIKIRKLRVGREQCRVWLWVWMRELECERFKAWMIAFGYTRLRSSLCRLRHENEEGKFRGNSIYVYAHSYLHSARFVQHMLKDFFWCSNFEKKEIRSDKLFIFFLWWFLMAHKKSCDSFYAWRHKANRKKENKAHKINSDSFLFCFLLKPFGFSVHGAEL